MRTKKTEDLIITGPMVKNMYQDPVTYMITRLFVAPFKFWRSYHFVTRNSRGAGESRCLRYRGIITFSEAVT